jgi:hypothetical protein
MIALNLHWSLNVVALEGAICYPRLDAFTKLEAPCITSGNVAIILETYHWTALLGSQWGRLAAGTRINGIWRNIRVDVMRIVGLTTSHGETKAHRK